jgi:hypothetical protein
MGREETSEAVRGGEENINMDGARNVTDLI